MNKEYNFTCVLVFLFFYTLYSCCSEELLLGSQGPLFSSSALVSLSGKKRHGTSQMRTTGNSGVSEYVKEKHLKTME